MNIQELAGKRIAIIGFGKEGQAALRFVESHVPTAEVTVLDERPLSFLDSKYAQKTGSDYLEDLEQFDYLIKSPGIRPHPSLEAIKSRLLSGTEIFLEKAAELGVQVIGITGSKGKSTTASLIYQILEAAHKNTYLVGNIGQPALDFFAELAPGVIIVQELSSYQLVDLQISPPIAVLTSFFPDHLDVHGSLGAYWQAKSQITRHQKPEDCVFYSPHSPECQKMAQLSPGQHISFTTEDSPVKLDEIQLIGRHNLSNIAGAYKVAMHLGISHDVAVEAIKQFKGLPHRLERIGTYHGITWVDDAISTTPESTCACLDALGDEANTLILGGLDRGYDFSELGKWITRSSVQQVILFPESGHRIKEAIIQAGGSQPVFYSTLNMAEAVEIAKKATTPGKTCVLSPASPSYNMFRNFEEKGEEFARYIRL